MSTTVRPAKVTDGQAIFRLVNAYGQRGIMLSRSQSAVYQAIREFMVAEEDQQMIGCGALQVTWGDLGEIRSLAVADAWRGQGVGRLIVQQLLEEAGQLGLPRVFALTYQSPFFERLGFRSVDKETLPQKIWADCVECVKFPNCDEEAVLIELVIA